MFLPFKKFYKIAVFVCIAISISFTTIHEYHVSVTDIEYVKEKETVQIITRIFIDDFEKLLRQRYDKKITLGVENESETINQHIEKYLHKKINIKVNNQDEAFVFLGKEYKEDMVVCYIEIKNITNITSFEVQNRILFDAFTSQKNIIKTNINSVSKSLILTKNNDKGTFYFE